MKKRIVLALALVLSCCGVAQSTLASDWNGAWSDGETYFATVERNGVLLFLELDNFGTVIPPGAIEGNSWIAGVGDIDGNTATITQHASDCQYVLQLNLQSDSTLSGTVGSATPVGGHTCDMAPGAPFSFSRIF